MRHTLKQSALLLTLALAIGAPAALAKTKTKKAKPSAEHVAAIHKCNDDFKAAEKAAKSQKGRARKDAQSAAKQAHKQCIAAAPM